MGKWSFHDGQYPSVWFHLPAGRVTARVKHLGWTRFYLFGTLLRRNSLLSPWFFCSGKQPGQKVLLISSPAVVGRMTYIIFLVTHSGDVVLVTISTIIIIFARHLEVPSEQVLPQLQPLSLANIYFNFFLSWIVFGILESFPFLFYAWELVNWKSSLDTFAN